MANTGVKGQIVFAESGAGIKDLQVVAVDLDPVYGEEVLNPNRIPALTDSDGRFDIRYTVDQYRQWYDRNPDIVIRIYGRGLRLLHETREKADVKDAMLDIGTCKIHGKNVEGWLVTNATLHPLDGTPVALTDCNEITWLIDGGKLYPAITEEVKTAKHSIHLMNLNYWVSDKLITEFPKGFDHKNPPLNQRLVGEGIPAIMKAKAGPNTNVRVLVHNVPLSNSYDTADEVEDYFKGSQVCVRTSRHYWELMHAKTVTVDAKTAFVMGAGIGQGYFSDQEHLIHDARHGGGLMHDVSLKLQGPAVEHVDGTFATIWNAVGPLPTLLPDKGQNRFDPGIGVQIVRTLPGGLFIDSRTGVSIPHGETGPLEAYQRAIANAQEFVYLEDQYFTCPEIVTALLKRMKAVKDLEVIVLINAEPDVFGYPQYQINLIREFQKELAQIEKDLGQTKDRLGIFTLWSTNPTTTVFEIMPIYVHSKVGIVDDSWATVGSANLDGHSMNHAQTGTIFDATFDLKLAPIIAGSLSAVSLVIFVLTALFGATVFFIFLGAVAGLGILGTILKPFLVNYRLSQHASPQLDKQPPRSVEMNLVIYNNIAGQKATTKIQELWRDLWTEHLGTQPTTKPAGGWVELWKKQADAKKKAIQQRQKHPAMILEWQHESESEKFLSRAGIPPAPDLCIRKKAHKFNFETGNWENLDCV